MIPQTHSLSFVYPQPVIKASPNPFVLSSHRSKTFISRPVHNNIPRATLAHQNGKSSHETNSNEHLHENGSMPSITKHNKFLSNRANFISDSSCFPPESLEWCTTNGTAYEVNPKVNERLKSLVKSDNIPESMSSTVTSPFSVDSLSERICTNDDDLYAPRVEQAFVDTFRMSSPYIHAHQGLVFVIHIPGTLLEEPNFMSVMQDIALMSIVGIKLILVLGPQSKIDRRLQMEKIPPRFVNGTRVTDSRTLQIVMEIAGSMRFEVEGTLSRGVTSMPCASRMSIVSGSFYLAQPLGVVNGEDFGYTGKVRRIDVESITKRLDQGDVIILPNIGSSPSGQHFNCQSEEVAAACAAQLKAEKLIFMGSGETLYDSRTQFAIPNLTLKSASDFLKLRAHQLPPDFRLSLECSVNALEKGVRRAHILNRHHDGVLLMEMFHRDGVGLMVATDQYEGFRVAELSDVNGVMDIIEPLQSEGILRYRSRTALERCIGEFVVFERDGMIIACMSLSVLPDDPTWAELGCVAVHKDYRKLGKGNVMLKYTELMAYDMGVRNLIILSTQSFDWFMERGFTEVPVDDLPASKRLNYDETRKSKIFHKPLEKNSVMARLR